MTKLISSERVNFVLSLSFFYFVPKAFDHFDACKLFFERPE